MPSIETSLRGLLNRVSESNKCIIVRNLTDLLKDINEDNAQSEAIVKFIEKLFQKCVSERNFTELYVDILYETLVSIRPTHPDLASKIYRSLVIHSQKEFEEDITPNNRMDKINCTRFIAQLTNKKFINSKILHDILMSLLESGNQYKYELACVLINQVDKAVIAAANVKGDIDFLVAEKHSHADDSMSKRIAFMLEDSLSILHATT